MLDIFRPPRHSVGDSGRRTNVKVKFVALLCDVSGFWDVVRNILSSFRKTKQSFALLLQDLGFCSLWISIIHHLVEKLVDNDKVVSDAFLFNFLEVLFEDLLCSKGSDEKRSYESGMGR